MREESKDWALNLDIFLSNNAEIIDLMRIVQSGKTYKNFAEINDRRLKQMKIFRVHGLKNS